MLQEASLASCMGFATAFLMDMPGSAALQSSGRASPVLFPSLFPSGCVGPADHSLIQKQRLQQLFFPEGVACDGKRSKEPPQPRQFSSTRRSRGR